jgi:hypothetical protein
LNDFTKYSTLLRVDSYFEHLAGPFFPPDAHDILGLQKEQILKMKSKPKDDICFPTNFIHADLKENDYASWKASRSVWQNEIVTSQRFKITERAQPTSKPKRQTSANIALKVGRALSAGCHTFAPQSIFQTSQPTTALKDTSQFAVTHRASRPKTACGIDSSKAELPPVRIRPKTAGPSKN